MMTKFAKVALLGVLTVAVSQALRADEVVIPVGSQGRELGAPDLPQRGTLRDTIVKRYGNPVSVQGPVGDPPITRLEYAEFYVYLEYDHAIHSVLKFDGSASK